MTTIEYPTITRVEIQKGALVLSRKIGLRQRQQVRHPRGSWKSFAITSDGVYRVELSMRETEGSR